MSVAATLIYSSDPVALNDGHGDSFDSALDLDTVKALEAEWLRLIRIRAPDGRRANYGAKSYHSALPVEGLHAVIGRTPPLDGRSGPE